LYFPIRAVLGVQCAVVTQVGYTYFVDVFSLFQLSVNERRGAV